MSSGKRRKKERKIGSKEEGEREGGRKGGKGGRRGERKGRRKEKKEKQAKPYLNILKMNNKCSRFLEDCQYQEEENDNGFSVSYGF